MHNLFIGLIGMSQVIFCIYLYVMFQKRKRIFLNIERAEREAKKRHKDFLRENKNIDEEYEKAKKLLDEEVKRLKTEINSANGSLRSSLEFTLKNLEKRRAKLFENYLSSNLNSLEELK